MAERKGCRLRTNPLFARQMRAIEKQIDDVPRKPESSVKARKKDRLAESPSEDPYRNPRSGVTSSVLARRRRNASPLRESSERQKESTEGVESSGNTPWSSMTEARKRVPSFLTTPKEKRQRSSREFERGSTGSSARCRRQLHSPLETGEIEEERCRYCHTYLESGSKCNCQRRIYQGPATSNIVQQFADSASHTPDPSPVVVLQGCQVGTCFLTEDAYSRLAPMGMLDDSVIDFFMQFVYNFILTEAQRDQFYFLSP
ncbi:MAG: hypothetical protein KVP17_001799, partial [Porospora cf. gigantea B]|uniref:uncharacterized protein n=1 Tax=Porospora cf. gigantea B TaxID=2853592 RepID=UPI003571C09A